MDIRSTPPEALPCDDFMQFSKLLSQWRKADDRVRHQLNSALPTVTLKGGRSYKSECENLFNDINENHTMRNEAIKYCISRSVERLSILKKGADEATETEKQDALKRVRKEQLKVRQFQSELMEEEIIQTSAMKVIYERCRDYFQHPVFNRFK